MVVDLKVVLVWDWVVESNKYTDSIKKYKHDWVVSPTIKVIKIVGLRLSLLLKHNEQKVLLFKK